MTWLDALLACAAIPLAFACVYLFALTLLSIWPSVPAGTRSTLTFDIIVPAHNEAAGIGSTVESLLKLDWPASQRRVVVVADNCSDNTAQLARDGGATVLERQSDTEKGKGYALQFAFDQTTADAVVVVDADTKVSSNLLKSFATRVALGAHACQAYYGVDNVGASWRTTLMAVAFSMFHRVRGRGRERLQLSCGLKGNGMCFTRELLKAVPHDAFSVVEDLEFGIRLGKTGRRVWYVDEASVRGEMVTGEKHSRSQRVRWESGRKAMVRAHVGPLLRDALKQRSAVLFDLAVDLLIPPLSYLGVGTVTLGLAGAALTWFGAPGLSVTVAAFCAGVLGCYLLRGWQLSETGGQGLVALARAPLYVVWKVALMRKESGAPKEWVRTEREKKGGG
jgi:cellulose synthase/poly-beta-1,6-N-acetylglucosamine synthase-like glycosyltransferase